MGTNTEAGAARKKIPWFWTIGFAIIAAMGAPVAVFSIVALILWPAHLHESSSSIEWFMTNVLLGPAVLVATSVLGFGVVATAFGLRAFRRSSGPLLRIYPWFLVLLFLEFVLLGTVQFYFGALSDLEAMDRSVCLMSALPPLYFLVPTVGAGYVWKLLRRSNRARWALLLLILAAGAAYLPIVLRERALDRLTELARRSGGAYKAIKLDVQRRGLPEGLVADVEALRIRGFNGLRDDDLADLKHSRKLKTLMLDADELSDAALMHVRHLHEFTGLELTGSRFTNGAVAMIPNPSGLKELGLHGTGFRDEGFPEGSSFPALEYLSVSRSGIGDVGLSRLVARSIASVSVWRSQVSAPGLARALRATPLLRSLEVSGRQVDEEVFDELSRMERFADLLLLGDDGFTDWVDSLSQLPRLGGLSVVNAGVDDRLLEVVGKMKSLSFLSLRNVPVTDVGLKELHPLKMLRSIVLFRTNTSEAGRAAFQKSNPELVIETINR